MCRCIKLLDSEGQDNVIGVAMPSPFSSASSLADATALAKNLDIALVTIPIGDTFQAYLEALAQAFQTSPTDVTEENLQARIRGNILMALSNKFGYLVLTTGNKSEMATGYATLYGDMAGGFAVLKDVMKTRVYALANCRNEAAGYSVIPESVISKSPTAELKPEQLDSDFLPPYDTLDQILLRYVEQEESPEEIMNAGFS